MPRRRYGRRKRPRRRRRRTRRTRRTYSRRRVASRFSQISRSLKAPYCRFRHTYDGQFVGGWTGAGAILEGIRMNDMYDPVYSVGGGQPRYFDQLAVFYNVFVVVKATLTLRVQYASGGAPSVPVRIVAYQTGGDTPDTEYAWLKDFRELPGPKAISRVFGDAGNGKRTATIKMTWYPSKMDPFQTTRSWCSDVSMWGNTAGAPAEKRTCFFGIVPDQDGRANGGETYTIHATVAYDAIWGGRKTPADS